MSLCETCNCEKEATLELLRMDEHGVQHPAGKFCDEHFDDHRDFEEIVRIADSPPPCPEDTVARFGLNKLSMKVDDHREEVRRLAQALEGISGRSVELAKLVAEGAEHRAATFHEVRRLRRDAAIMRAWMFALAAFVVGLSAAVELGWL